MLVYTDKHLSEVADTSQPLNMLTEDMLCSSHSSHPPITAGAATIKDFASEWEIACGFVQQTFFCGQEHVLFQEARQF